MVQKIIIGLIYLTLSAEAYSQCCGGGSGSPIAGGSSQGVLQEKQMEVNVNYQNINTSKALNSDTTVPNFIDHYYSQYIYSRIAYGVTKNFTMSVESGYFINKTQYGLHHIDTISSSGIADLLIFPRYDVLNRTDEKTTTEITLGLGYKIPLGKYNDSLILFHNPVTGINIYDKKIPAVQPSNGSQDMVFYSFFFRGYPSKNFRIFSSILYIKKGWNPNGEKFGDYASIGFFAGKTFFHKLGITIQLKGENIDKMQRNKDLPFPNYDPEATGMKKISLVPQLSYGFFHSKLSVYTSSEFPLYQYVNKTQVASQFLTTVGLSYRFFTYSGDRVGGTKIKIKTSAQCEKCQDRIESNLHSVKGVISVKLDLTTREVTVVYNPKKTTPEAIKLFLTQIGYDANDMPADVNVYDKLPSCCKKPK